MMNESSKYLMIADGNMKFHFGDKICRSGDEMMKSEHYIVNGAFMEIHPFYEQVWYMLTNYRGERVTALQHIVEDNFHTI